MSKEELEILKNEIREELRVELKKEIESQKYIGIWTKYTKEVLKPLAEKKYGQGKDSYSLRNALNTIARLKVGKSATNKITEAELEEVKPLIESILTQMEIKQ